MNRTALGLAIGAGYLLGRTRKLKLALAVGSVVAGKRLNLTPRGVADLVSQQLQNNPQFKEIGDQLREDLRGVGKAATGAVVERQLDSLAGRLHGRTAEVRGRLDGVVPEVAGRDEDDDADAGADADAGRERAKGGRSEGAGKPRKKAPGAKKAADAARKTASPERVTKKAAPRAAKKPPARSAKRGDER
ncbi:DNA primase [Streptomyces niveiscabiei]|uniref:DNA primase n=1 Tax=Streptomyces niveiscabiei TaxID=164115 RepID=UPI0029A0588B|nr:DNA primase [Streptomyces niveiscabiei]MDX3382492.1 DNA primase [Streptomyces niveiscabiei]